METWLIILPILLPWLGAVVVWALQERAPRLQHALAVACALGGGAAAILLLPYAGDEALVRVPLGAVFGEFSLVADGLGLFLTIIATVVGGLAGVFSGEYMRGEA